MTVGAAARLRCMSMAEQGGPSDCRFPPGELSEASGKCLVADDGVPLRSEGTRHLGVRDGGGLYPAITRSRLERKTVRKHIDLAWSPHRTAGVHHSR